jgi:replicative DNA helicase
MTRTAERAEQSLLGAALLRPSLLPGLRWIHPGDFRLPAHGHLWRVLHHLGPGHVSPTAVSTTLQQAEPGLRNSLSPNVLAGLVEACPAPDHAPLYGGMVLESALHRTVERVGSDLRTRAAHGTPDEAAELLAEARQAAAEVPGLGVRWALAPETVRNLLDTTPDNLPDRVLFQQRGRVDPEAERVVVASLLRYPDQAPEIGYLRGEDFADHHHAATFEAIGRLTERRAPIDPLTVAWESQRAGGPQPQVDQLMELHREGVPGQADYAGRTVVGTAALDRLDHTGRQIQAHAMDPALDVPHLLDRTAGAVAPLDQTHDRLLGAVEPEIATPAPLPMEADL